MAARHIPLADALKQRMRDVALGHDEALRADFESVLHFVPHRPSSPNATAAASAPAPGLGARVLAELGWSCTILRADLCRYPRISAPGRVAASARRATNFYTEAAGGSAAAPNCTEASRRRSSLPSLAVPWREEREGGFRARELALEICIFFVLAEDRERREKERERKAAAPGMIPCDDSPSGSCLICLEAVFPHTPGAMVFTCRLPDCGSSKLYCEGCHALQLAAWSGGDHKCPVCKFAIVVTRRSPLDSYFARATDAAIFSRISTSQSEEAERRARAAERESEEGTVGKELRQQAAEIEAEIAVNPVASASEWAEEHQRNEELNEELLQSLGVTKEEQQAAEEEIKRQAMAERKSLEAARRLQGEIGSSENSGREGGLRRHGSTRPGGSRAPDRSRGEEETEAGGKPPAGPEAWGDGAASSAGAGTADSSGKGKSRADVGLDRAHMASSGGESGGGGSSGSSAGDAQGGEGSSKRATSDRGKGGDSGGGRLGGRDDVSAPDTKELDLAERKERAAALLSIFSALRDGNGDESKAVTAAARDRKEDRAREGGEGGRCTARDEDEIGSPGRCGGQGRGKAKGARGAESGMSGSRPAAGHQQSLSVTRTFPEQDQKQVAGSKGDGQEKSTCNVPAASLLASSPQMPTRGETGPDSRALKTVCWDCKHGRFAPRRNTRSQCREVHGHTACDWREDPRQLGPPSPPHQQRSPSGLDRQNNGLGGASGMGGSETVRLADADLLASSEAIAGIPQEFLEEHARAEQRRRELEQQEKEDRELAEHCQGLWNDGETGAMGDLERPVKRAKTRRS